MILKKAKPKGIAFLNFLFLTPYFLHPTPYFLHLIPYNLFLIPYFLQLQCIILKTSSLNNSP